MWLLFLLLSIACAASAMTFAKLSLNRSHYQVFNAVWVLFIAAAMWAAVAYVGSFSGIYTLSTETWTYLILTGLLTGFAWTCFYRALQHAPVTELIPVSGFSIVIVFIIGVLFLHDTITFTSVAGIATAAFGLWMMIRDKRSEEEKEQEPDASHDENSLLTQLAIFRPKSSGGWLVWGVAATVFVALTDSTGRVLTADVEANLGMAIRAVVILAVMAAVLLAGRNIRTAGLVTPKVWTVIALTGILTGLAWFLMNCAVAEGPEQFVAMGSEVELIAMLFFAAIVLKEHVSREDVIGAVQFVIGIIVLLF
jgi:transporter family protein